MSDNTKKRESAYSQLKGFHRAVPIILFALAVFIAVCFITQSTGTLGRAISGFFLGTFSIGAYFIPAMMALHAIFYPTDIKKKRVLISRILFSLVLVITVSVLTHAIANYGQPLTYSPSELYQNGMQRIGGGFIGGTFAYGIISMIDYVGLIILTVTIFTLYIVYFLAGEDNAVRKALGKVVYKVVSVAARIEAKIKGNKDFRKEEKARKESKGRRLKETKRAEALMAKEEKLYDDEFFAVDNGLKELRIAELGINEQRSDEDIEKNPTLHEKVRPRSATKEENVQASAEEPERTQREPEKKKFNADYGISENGDIIFDSPSEFSRERTDSAYTASDKADSVFTEDFNPYSLKYNEKLANKPSSKAAFSSERESDGVTELRGSETAKRVFSEKELEEARRRARFELRREELIKEEAARKEAELRAEQERQAEALRQAEAARQAETERQAEAARQAEIERQAEAARQAEIERQAEAARQAETERQVEAARQSFNEPSPVTGMAQESSYSAFSQPAPTFTARVEETDTSFRSFSSPEPQVYREMPMEEAEDTIKITRSVMTDALADEDEEENDDTLCVFTEQDEPEEKDENASVSAVFEFDDEDDGDDVEEVEIPPEKQNPDVLKYRELYSMFNEPARADVPLSEPEESEDEADIADESAFEDTALPYEDKTEQEEDEVPFDDYMPIRSPIAPEPKKTEPEKPEVQKPDYSAFKFPPIDLLAKGKDSEDPSIELEIQENGEKLIDALAQFNVRASVRSVDRGPRITRYEIVPARGVRVNSVISLFDDIALNLAAEGIRMEAPIPGKSAIGVEIPNKHPTTVMLRDLLETEEFKNESSKTFSCVGKDVTGNPVFGDMSKMPHILVAGATGMGKSVCINSILISILYKARPDEVKFIMIDPKTVEFTMYNGIPHLLVPVVTDVKQAAGALMWAIDEMNRRYELMAKHEVRKLDSYNDLVRENPELGEPLPKIIIVIDELNDLMQQVRKPVEGLITNITQKARAAGIHMIIGTQRPSVDVITGVIKANVPSRISCKVTSFNDSKTILDQAGAEKLLDKGDMLYAPVGKPKPVRVQGAFVSDGEVEKIMKFLKSNVKGAVYDEQAMEGINRAAQKCVKGGKDSGIDDDFDTDSEADGGGGYLSDKQFLEAADLATKQGKISTSLIQRKIGVGYGKAAKFIDIMEELGIVSEPNGQKPRDVLVTRDEWREMLSRRSLDD